MASDVVLVAPLIVKHNGSFSSRRRRPWPWRPGPPTPRSRMAWSRSAFSTIGPPRMPTWPARARSWPPGRGWRPRSWSAATRLRPDRPLPLSRHRAEHGPELSATRRHA